jgi:hypothetical protein
MEGITNWKTIDPSLLESIPLLHQVKGKELP